MPSLRPPMQNLPPQAAWVGEISVVRKQTAFSIQKSSQAIPTTTIFWIVKIAEAELGRADMDDWWAELLPFSSLLHDIPLLPEEHALNPP